MDRTVAVDYLTDHDRLAGLRLAAVEIRDEGPVPVPHSHERVAAAMVVSSIGSIPEPIPGVEMRGSLYRIRDLGSGEIEGLDGVFVVGNAATGRGNILVSQKHGRLVSQNMLDHYLAGQASGYEEVLTGAAASARARVEAVTGRLAQRSPLPESQVAAILDRVKALQGRVGYPGNYAEWIDRVRPLAV